MESAVFGGEEHERLEITVLGYEGAAIGEYHDDNWLSVEVAVRCGAFQGRFPAAFLTSELVAFHRQLVSLYRTLSGTAEFKTLEGQLDLTATGDGLGHITIAGEAQDQAGTGHRLIFEIEIDQTQLQTSVRSLETVLAAYPLRT